MTFEADRDLIVSLSERDAKSVLGLLDNGASDSESPADLRTALAAAKRSPDVSRYFLVNTTPKKDDHAPQKRRRAIRRK